MTEQAPNPYAAPSADLDVKIISDKLMKLPRISAWWVFLLNIVTLGIYPCYWLYSRIKIINQLHARPIPLEQVYALIGLLVVSLVVGFWAGINGEESSALENALNLIYFGVFVVTIYAVRNRLHDLFEEAQHPAKTGPILTFFFSNIYLQFKINEAIDSKTQTPSV